MFTLSGKTAVCTELKSSLAMIQSRVVAHEYSKGQTVVLTVFLFTSRWLYLCECFSTQIIPFLNSSLTMTLKTRTTLYHRIHHTMIHIIILIIFHY